MCYAQAASTRMAEHRFHSIHIEGTGRHKGLKTVIFYVNNEQWVRGGRRRSGRNRPGSRARCAPTARSKDDAARAHRSITRTVGAWIRSGSRRGSPNSAQISPNTAKGKNGNVMRILWRALLIAAFLGVPAYAGELKSVAPTDADSTCIGDPDHAAMCPRHLDGLRCPGGAGPVLDGWLLADAWP